MPWNNQGSGGGGGPWGPRGSGGGGGGGPWGGGPQGGGGSGQTPPDLEEILRKGQDRLKNMVPGGGSMGGKGIALILIGVVVVWLLTGFYTVRPNQVGLNLIFGAYVGQTAPGLNYNLPFPIGQVIKPDVTQVNRVEVGYRSATEGQRPRDALEESLMLTGDENIVDIDFDVQWQIDAARAEEFVFEIQNPEGTIKAVAESSMREVIGRRDIQAILTIEQGEIMQEVQEIMQATLEDYSAGVTIRVVQLQAAVPPAQVREAFFDVNAAQQDLVRLQNEAETYASRVVPEARGRAARIIQEAEGYRERVVNDAQGQASRFTQVFDEYVNAPDVTRERLFLETMERVLAGTDKVVIDQSNGDGQQSVVPYLPLPEIQRRAQGGSQ
ncbi:MAG: membrane protease subunit HflK [Saliniramus fredricksonii]|uniref:Protein HflK n=1 Tax=Saliniramus fredricksonii TaxID=1653334 RepID=A0A0P8A8N8_9HYPH|nr:FtsH protease activity modulator HflK [Saliniramus fredricksonii]KPQ11502.1 MAG: membrane protease subunit HflK [Saliniramus fredricksonii]SCC82409.1 protease FtsH subunit HflK [Saliniramus fredricksonii]